VHIRSLLVLVALGVACAFDSGGEADTEAATSGTSDPTSSSTDATTVSTTATTAMTSDDTDATTATTVSTTMTSDDTDATTTAPSTTDATESADDSSTGSPGACAVDNGGCDPDATCADESGSVKCECNPGFVGPGTACATTPVLPTLRANLPCVGGDCFGAATCTTAATADASVVMTGDADVVYGVTIDLNGVLEHKEYDGGDCDGQWCIGGDPDPSPWNAVTIVVSDPPAEYHPNNGAGGVYEVFPVDEQRVIAIAGGATVSIEIDGDGTCSIDNGQGIVIPGVRPDPDPFNGQFLQIDLVDATIAG